MTAAMRAALLHLSAGALVSAGVVVPMVAVWYAPPLFEAAGTGRLPVFVALLAVCLGPIVSFYANHATGLASVLRRNRVVIAQLIALAGCALALYVQRPVYFVFTVDRFDLVIAKDIDPRDLAKASRVEYQRRPLGAPRYVAALQPEDKTAVQRILMDAVQGGKDLQAYPQYYVPYAQEAKNALRRAKPLSAARAKDPAAVDGYLAASGRAEGSVKFLPLRARKRDGIVLLDAASGVPLEILLIDPW